MRNVLLWGMLSSMVLVSAGCANTRPPAPAQPAPDVVYDWSAEDRAATAHVLALAAGARTVTLDLSDPRTAHFWRRHSEISGFTRDRYPGFHGLMDRNIELHEVSGSQQPMTTEVTEDLLYQDLATLMLALYATESATYTGNAAASWADTSTDPDNLQITYASLCFYDAANNPIGSCTSQSSFGSGQYFPLANALTTSQEIFTGAFSATYYDTAQKRYVPQISTLTLSATEYPQMQTITDPVIVHAENDSLKEALVCTSRTVNANANPGTCDYGNYGETGVLVDMGGSVSFQTSQDPQVSGDDLVGTGSVSLINTVQGGQCTLSPTISGSSFFAQPEVTYDATTKTVVWDFTALDFGSATDLICGGDGTDIQFSLVLQVPDQANPGQVIVASQTSVPGTVVPTYRGPNAGALATPMLALVAGCLHPDTRITLADGSTRAIGELRGEGEPVRSLGGVETFVVGTVDGEEETLYRVVAADGREVLASSEHPFVGADGGWIAAANLAPGTRVLTDQGAVEVRTVETVPYGGPVHNLLLDRSPDALHRDTETFYANGFLVGGHDAQQRLAQAQRAAPERVAPRVPPELAVDYASHLEDRKPR